MRDTASEASRRTDYDFKIEREYRVPPQVVFNAYLAMHGEDRPAWIVDSQLDLRVGGKWTVAFHPPGVGPFRELRVLSVVDPPHRLKYTMTAMFEGTPSFDTTVEILFDEQSNGTRLSLSQSGFPTPEVRDDFAGGWPGVFDTLQQFIAR